MLKRQAKQIEVLRGRVTLLEAENILLVGNRQLSNEMILYPHSILVNDKEKTLIELLRQIPYGEVVIFMQDSQPVRIERVKESIKL